jgi:hypothetical protein
MGQMGARVFRTRVCPNWQGGTGTWKSPLRPVLTIASFSIHLERRLAAPAVKREEEEDWAETNGDDRSRRAGAYPEAGIDRSSGDWNDDDYDVLADGVVVGRIFKAARPHLRARRGCGPCYRWPTHGYAATREAATAAFAKSWRYPRNGLSKKCTRAVAGVAGSRTSGAP